MLWAFRVIENYLQLAFSTESSDKKHIVNGLCDIHLLEDFLMTRRFLVICSADPAFFSDVRSVWRTDWNKLLWLGCVYVFHRQAIFLAQRSRMNRRKSVILIRIDVKVCHWVEQVGWVNFFQRVLSWGLSTKLNFAAFVNHRVPFCLTIRDDLLSSSK